jgi:hypothetical protein
VTTEELLAAYRDAAAASDRSIESVDLDAPGTHPGAGITMSLRSMLLIVLMDTTRHAGHADIVRELIDGATGGRDSPSRDASDEDYWATYLARVRGEIDTAAWGDYIRSRTQAQS